MVGGDDEVGVVRDVDLPQDPRLQHALVEQPLRQRQAALAGRRDRRRNVDLALALVLAGRPPRAAATGPRASSSCSSATVPSVVTSTLSGSAIPAFSSALASSAYIRLSNPSSPKRLPICTSARRRPDTVATVSSSQPTAPSSRVATASAP